MRLQHCANGREAASHRGHAGGHHLQANPPVDRYLPQRNTFRRQAPPPIPHLHFHCLPPPRQCAPSITAISKPNPLPRRIRKLKRSLTSFTSLALKKTAPVRVVQATGH
ncbi:hypothetical protein SEVIR_9G232500v4 [Setaria viridis]|uniref:Uncharacterized protein n=2 Tax=Setaria TaxID=4554 RepID=A0A368SJQ0_SETIT|nr:hypothetical protein SETIT_9G232800v2 [Setaria italica]TKV93543.1 hypothetical protein SEVIR_9G232500v2 [Setaria viridis]